MHPRRAAFQQELGVAAATRNYSNRTTLVRYKIVTGRAAMAALSSLVGAGPAGWAWACPTTTQCGMLTPLARR
jgi:hypothetical protein